MPARRLTARRREPLPAWGHFSVPPTPQMPGKDESPAKAGMSAPMGGFLGAAVCLILSSAWSKLSAIGEVTTPKEIAQLCAAAPAAAAAARERPRR